MYNITYGDASQNVIKQARRLNKAPPIAIANKPKLKDWTVFYLNAFYTLDSERKQPDLPTQIPWSAIIAFASYHGFDKPSTDALIRIINRADSAYIKALVEKREKALKQNGK